MGVQGGTNCFSDVPISSNGIWLQGSPFKASLPLLMIQIVLIVAISRILHHFLRYFGQPILVSQIITGIILGPTLLGRWRFFQGVVFPESSWLHLNNIGVMGLILFWFMIGLKTDLSMIGESGKKAVAIALVSRLVPVTLVTSLAPIFAPLIPDSVHGAGFLQIGVVLAWSMSSFVVIACLLEELHLLNSKVGRVAISASLLDNLLDIAFRILTTMAKNSLGIGSGVKWLGSLTSLLALLAFVFWVARPLALWIVHRTPAGEPVDEGCFLTILVLVLGCGLFSELIGYHARFGTFLVGLALPSGPPLGSSLVERLEGVITTLSIPVFLARAGLRIDLLSILDNVRTWGFVELFLGITVLGKIVGVMVPAMYYRMPLREAFSLALVLASKGINEVEILCMWNEYKYIGSQLSSALTVSILLIAAVTAPLVKALHNPSARYANCKRRALQHTRHQAELRFLACVHGEEDVSSIVGLFEAMCVKDHPVSLFVVHLVQLAGRAAAVLAPYRKCRALATGSGSDRIVNAFQTFEQHCGGFLTMQPYISICPYASMHEDVCTLAVDKKVAMVIIPFYRKMGISGTINASSHHLKMVNTSLLSYAPCSIGILVDHGSSVWLYKFAVYFLGGPDDREALAFAMRMADNPRISVTVVHFLHEESLERSSSSSSSSSKNGESRKDDEQKADEDIVGQFRLMTDKRLVYQEEIVQDGETMISVIRTMSSGFSLLIVGRGEGRESPLTIGMSVWSEYEDLGLIGDMLASMDFGTCVSTLVVQQQNGAGFAETDSPKNPGRSAGEKRPAKTVETPKDLDPVASVRESDG